MPRSSNTTVPFCRFILKTSQVRALDHVPPDYLVALLQVGWIPGPGTTGKTPVSTEPTEPEGVPGLVDGWRRFGPFRGHVRLDSSRWSPGVAGVRPDRESGPNFQGSMESSKVGGSVVGICRTDPPTQVAVLPFRPRVGPGAMGMRCISRTAGRRKGEGMWEALQWRLRVWSEFCGVWG